MTEKISLPVVRGRYYFVSKSTSNVDIKDVFRKIAMAFEGEPHLLSVSPGELEESFKRGNSMFILNEAGEPIGHTRLVELTKVESASGEWYELGSTWVNETYRGHNLNVLLYQEFLSMHADKNILATTTNEASVVVGKKLGFVMIPRKRLPEEVWRASCVCSVEKTGVADNAECKLAWKEKQLCGSLCWFRITAETAMRMGIS